MATFAEKWKMCPVTNFKSTIKQRVWKLFFRDHYNKEFPYIYLNASRATPEPRHPEAPETPYIRPHPPSAEPKDHRARGHQDRSSRMAPHPFPPDRTPRIRTRRIHASHMPRVAQASAPGNAAQTREILEISGMHRRRFRADANMGPRTGAISYYLKAMKPCRHTPFQGTGTLRAPGSTQPQGGWSENQSWPLPPGGYDAGRVRGREGPRSYTRRRGDQTHRLLYLTDYMGAEEDREAQSLDCVGVADPEKAPHV